MKQIKVDIVDLKKNLLYLEQYIELRNSYASTLLTDKVTKGSTTKWILNDSIHIKIAVYEKTLLGVVILYLDKDNEVSIFTKEQNKGLGTALLQKIENEALAKQLTHLNSWIEDSNEASKALFLKQNYSILKREFKIYNNINYAGSIFQKKLY